MIPTRLQLQGAQAHEGRKYEPEPKEQGVLLTSEKLATALNSEEVTFSRASATTTWRPFPPGPGHLFR